MTEMAKNSMPEGVKSVLYWGIGIGVLALVGLVMLILFGNLSGNLGFTAGSQGYNDTQDLILNYSKSVTNTASQFPTVGTIVGIALLLVILIGVLVFAIKKLMGVTSGGNSNGSFA